MNRRPEPEGVHVQRNGSRVNLTTMFVGVDSNGRDVYEVVDGDFQPGDILGVDRLPGNCSIIINGTRPSSVPPKEAV